MKLSFLKLSFVAVLCAPFAVACSVDGGADDTADGEDVSSDEANAARVTPGQFKLYDQPRITPNASCDRHTKLALSADGGSKAHLEDAVDGICTIVPSPNPRDYRLRDAGVVCGSRIFTGSYRKGGQRYAVKITDHRTRTCRDLVPAQIIVEETTPQGTVTRYSHDAAPAAETITVEGELFSSMGIGGENTGASIKTSDATYELVLDDGERARFEDGKKARVKGKKTTLSGVETRNRPAIDVESLLVCPNPGFVNCMPGPNRRPPDACLNENMSWVQANCPGVDFAF